MVLPFDKDLVHPVGNRVVLAVEELEEKIGDIVIAYAQNDKRVQECGREIGTVIALGPEAFNNAYIKDPSMKIGDKVLFVRYAGVEYELKDGRIRVMDDDKIYAKVQAKE